MRLRNTGRVRPRIGARPNSGFTLIELLIVVAIIAILALIAVPNLLEAQTRAKVARVRADLRSIATVIEAYAVDANDYPRNYWLGAQTITPDLTTPIAYLSSLNIHDPFAKGLIGPHYLSDEMKAFTIFYSYHRIVPLSELKRFPPDSPWRPDATSTDGPYPFNEGALRKYGDWMLHSIGPDRIWWYELLNWNDHDTLYDPTNGTISFGNLVRTQLHPEGHIPIDPLP